MNSSELFSVFYSEKIFQTNQRAYIWSIKIFATSISFERWYGGWNPGLELFILQKWYTSTEVSLQANRQQVQLKINRDPPLRTDHHDGRTMLRETPKKNEAWQRISLKLQTEGYFYVGIFHDDNQFVKWAGTRKFGNFFNFLNKLRSISIQSN